MKIAKGDKEDALFTLAGHGRLMKLLEFSRKTTVTLIIRGIIIKLGIFAGHLR